jgi:hypothetical protein
MPHTQPAALEAGRRGADNRYMHRARRVSLAIAAVAAGAAATGCGQAGSHVTQQRSGGAAAVATRAATTPVPGMPTPARARAIAGRLWGLRERALASLDPGRLRSFETRSAIAADTAYDRGVRCGCVPQKNAHPLLRVIPMIPRTPNGGSFIAQVRTANSTSGDHPWYVIAVERRGGAWRIAFVTFGGYRAAPPLEKLTPDVGYTPPVTAAAWRRITRLAHLAVRSAAAHAHHLVSHTDYGATVRARGAVRTGADGVYGLVLPAGKVLSCFTFHELDRYSLAGGLAQDGLRQQWGALLAPGAYRSITVDAAQTECTVGTGANARAGAVWLRYDPLVVGTTGVPLHR